MKIIYKYQLGRPGEMLDLELPKGAKFLHLGVQKCGLVAWFEFEQVLQKNKKQSFIIFGTGQSIPQGLRYLGTTQVKDTSAYELVWHLYQKFSEEK